jgi:hypothetical protein
MAHTQSAPQILLVRHGKPLGARNPWVSAGGFAQWVRHYDHSRLCSDSAPPPHLCELSQQPAWVVSSPLNRARHSAELACQRPPDEVLPWLAEMQIPRYRLPGRWPAYVWLYLNRGLWLLGKRGRFESWNSASQRAALAALSLHQSALQHGRVLAFGHVLINVAIARHLRRLGWVGPTRPTHYWGVLRLQLPASAAAAQQSGG